jgi:hypothetical protein
VIIKVFGLVWLSRLQAVESEPNSRCRSLSL